MRVVTAATLLTGMFLGTTALADALLDGQAAYDAGDYAAAKAAWLPLAEAGDLDAQMKVAGMYDSGEGVLEDDAVAMDWFRKAALSGDVEALVTLGNHHWVGSGETRDAVLAYVWLNAAAENGSRYAASRRDTIAASMSPSDAAEASTLAQTCKPPVSTACP